MFHFISPETWIEWREFWNPDTVFFLVIPLIILAMDVRKRGNNASSLSNGVNGITPDSPRRVAYLTPCDYTDTGHELNARLAELRIPDFEEMREWNCFWSVAGFIYKITHVLSSGSHIPYKKYTFETRVLFKKIKINRICVSFFVCLPDIFSPRFFFSPFVQRKKVFFSYFRN